MSQNRQDAWFNKRPVFLGLPEYGYQDNEPTEWLTQWVDLECVNAYDKVQELYALGDAYLCPVEHLDTLAWCVGLADEYWDASWSESVKRGMIDKAQWLFNHIGQLSAVEEVLNIHGIEYDIWQGTALILSFTLPATIGRHEMRFIVQLPLSVVRNGKVWKEAERTLRNYAPAIVISRVEYDAFYASFSCVGDAIYSYGS